MVTASWPAAYWPNVIRRTTLTQEIPDFSSRGSASLRREYFVTAYHNAWEVARRRLTIARSGRLLAGGCRFLPIPRHEAQAFSDTVIRTHLLPRHVTFLRRQQNRWYIGCIRLCHFRFGRSPYVGGRICTHSTNDKRSPNPHIGNLDPDVTGGIEKNNPG